MGSSVRFSALFSDSSLVGAEREFGLVAPRTPQSSVWLGQLRKRLDVDEEAIRSASCTPRTKRTLIVALGESAPPGMTTAPEVLSPAPRICAGGSSKSVPLTINGAIRSAYCDWTVSVVVELHILVMETISALRHMIGPRKRNSVIKTSLGCGVGMR